MLTKLASTVAKEQNRVQIVAGKAGIRITLGGLKGSVPVSIDNRLGFAIKVRMRLSFSQATGVKIVEDPAVVTIPAHSPRTIKLHIQAAEVGSTTITMRLETQHGQLLPSAAARMTVQATQVGVLGMIIFACALGVFLIASAARAVHHGRPVPAGTGGDAAGGVLKAWVVTRRAIRSPTASVRPATPAKEANWRANRLPSCLSTASWAQPAHPDCDRGRPIDHPRVRA